jgi:hypothetical protein
MSQIATTQRTKQLDAKKALVRWAKEKAITPATFSKATGYSYAHAWGLLKGKRVVTDETVGRTLAAFGHAPAKLLSDALNGNTAKPA